MTSCHAQQHFGRNAVDSMRQNGASLIEITGSRRATRGGPVMTDDHPLTSGQPPSLSGRNASAAGMVARVW